MQHVKKKMYKTAMASATCKRYQLQVLGEPAWMTFSYISCLGQEISIDVYYKEHVIICAQEDTVIAETNTHIEHAIVDTEQTCNPINKIYEILISDGFRTSPGDLCETEFTPYVTKYLNAAFGPAASVGDMLYEDITASTPFTHPGNIVRYYQLIVPVLYTGTTDIKYTIGKDDLGMIVYIQQCN